MSTNDSNDIALKEVQHKLEVSEVKFRRLFEAAQDGILLIDPKTDNIVDANPYLLNMVGYSKPEVIGKKLWEIGPFKDIKESQIAFAELKTKEYIRYEDMPLQAKDGRVVEVEFVSNRYPVDGTEMIQCNIRNITDRKDVEKIGATYLEEIIKTNKLLVERQKSMIDIGNIKDLSEREKIDKIIQVYSESLESLNKLIEDWKIKMQKTTN